MPKFETSEKMLFDSLGKTYTDAELEAIFPVAKAELDEHDKAGKVFKIELNDTNRPDLWSTCGLARALRQYQGEEPALYDFFSTADEEFETEGRTLIVEKDAPVTRPFSIGFAVKGQKVTEEILLALIQSQEKLCWNFGRKRKSIAMGIYRSELIKYPVHYSGADPDKTAFVPLALDEKLTLREILAKHPKGKEYGHIIANDPKFPYLYDDNGDTLSMPPVINSARIGAVEVGDSDLFVEMSGTVLKDLLLAASIMACDMADMGFEILPVRVEFPYETEFGSHVTVPYYFQEPVSCTVSEINKVLGLNINGEDAVAALKRMGVFAVEDGVRVYVTVPEYRNDFLNTVDIIEDVMIGYGLNNFQPEMPSDFTVGRLSAVEEYSRFVKSIMVGLGFQEMMYNYLGSEKEYYTRMNIPADGAVRIANPMSENYEVVRPSILPCLLESESMSAHAVYPHNIFEIGKVAYLDDGDNSGTVTKNHLGWFSSAIQMGYNDISSILSTLMYFLGKEYTLAPVGNDGRFIAGRCAKVMYNGKEAGIFGEINPQVLENWGCSMPAVACELDIDVLMN